MSIEPKEETPTQEGGQPKSEGSETNGPSATWEYRQDLRINETMREIIKLTQAVAQSEIDRLRRKVEKLTYGS